MRTDGRNLVLTLDGDDWECDATSVILDNEDADADLVTFADVIAGNDRRWFLEVIGLPDYGGGTFWHLFWATPAYTPIPYIINPYGSIAPTTTQPWFTGQATRDQPPPIGGNAGSWWTFTTRLTCTATPQRLTAVP